MLTGFLIALHVLACIFLILVILMQTGRGSGLAGIFGSSGGGPVFGGRGAAPFLIKVTAALGIIFMLSSIGQNLLSPTPKTSKSVIQQEAERRLRERRPAPMAPEEEEVSPIPVAPKTSEAKSP